MNSQTFRVDSRMRPPVIIGMLSGLALIIISVARDRNFLFLIALTPFLYLGLEILARNIVVDATGLTIQKLFRRKRVNWPEIENIDAVKAGSKIFLILSTSGSRPVIITNLIAHFSELVKLIIQNVAVGKVTESASEISLSNRQKLWPLIQAWLVCVIFFSVMLGKLLEWQ